MNKEDIYIELPRESITFYGDTEQEKKLNEMLFDMSLENASLYDENKELLRRNQKYKEVIDKAIEYIKIYRSYQKIDNKDYLKGRDEIGCLDICQVDELLDILKEVE